MLYSASAFSREALHAGDSFRFLKNQAVWLILGLIALGVTAFRDYRCWNKNIWWLLGGVVILLALCYVPGIGKRVNGANRWLGLGGLTLQPSELAKLALLLFVSWWYDINQRRVKTFLYGFCIPAAVCGVVLLFILFEKDVGTTLLLGAVLMILWFAAGVRWQYLVLTMVIAAGGVGFIVSKDKERLSRLWAHASRENKMVEKGEGWQQTQSLIALGSGGVEGLGIGESRQKLYYLPEAHTDFIFAIIGEELGLRATLMIVLGFVMYVVIGGYIATRASDWQGTLLALGIVTLVGLQAFINMGVVTRLLPNKGLALPFIRYGGSNLVVALAMTGWLVSIARHVSSEEETRWVWKKRERLT
ncbi:MAG: putative peptidoglycan glycosyltransferase FtsW [Verrucomicrobiia bacterium]